MSAYLDTILNVDELSISKTDNTHCIGVGRFRILGVPRFRILGGGGKGGAKLPAGT